MGNTDNRRFLSICGNRLQMTLSGRIKEIIFSLVDGQTSKVTHSDVSLIFTCCPGLFVPKKCSSIRQKWTICAVLFWNCVCVCPGCALCRLSDDDPAMFGEKVSLKEHKLSVHYFCLVRMCLCVRELVLLTLWGHVCTEWHCGDRTQVSNM